MYDFADAAGMGDFGMIGNLAAQSVRSGWRSALGGLVSGLVLTACLAPAAGAQAYRETVFNCHGSGSGALVSQTTPGGRTVSYQPDGLGRATRASDAQRVYASGAAYHPSGGLSALSYGNGLAFSASYSARQLMSAMQVSGGGTTAISFVYGRDPNGRITSISDLAVSGQYRTFGYDGLGRLTTATGPWGSGAYTYDALNNLTTRTLGSRVVEMQYDASNRLQRHRDTADGHVWRNYAYDSRGNVTNNGTIGFTYDRAERPVSISGAASGSFVYDAHGRRVKQVVGGQTIALPGLLRLHSTHRVE